MKKEKNKSKKSLSNTLLTILSFVLILSGSTILIKQFIDYKMSQQEITSVIDNFLNQPDVQLDEDGNVVVDDSSTPVIANTWGIIEINATSVSAPIVFSDDWNAMNRYVVAFSGSDDPTVENGNLALAAHYGPASCSFCFFTNNSTLVAGDLILIYDKTNIYTYEVYENKIVNYTDTSDLNRIDGQKTLTLVTCVTYNDPQRTITKARQISVEARS